MPIHGFKYVPTDPAQWDRFFRQAKIVPDDGSVGADQIKDESIPLAKLVLADADGKFVVRRLGALTFSALIDSDIPANIARDDDITDAISGITGFDTTITYTKSGSGESAAIVVKANTAAYAWHELGVNADNSLWDAVADGEAFKLRALLANGTATDFGVIDRTDGVIDSIRWSASIVHLDGVALFGNSTNPTRLVGKKEHTSTPASTLATGEWELVLFDDGTNPCFRVRYNDAGTTKYADVQMSASGGFVLRGSGTPEGAVTAAVGTLFLRSDGGAGTTLYVKESGSGNTGWIGK